MSEPAPAPPAATESPRQDPPPVLGSWRNMYLVVLGNLALLVALFYALARWAQ